MLTKVLTALVTMAIVGSSAVACTASTETGDDVGDTEQESDGTVGEVGSELRSSVSCNSESQPAYSGGNNIGSVDVIKVGGKRVTQKTGHAFLRFQRAAAAAGVDIGLNSGFRTMAEQRYFWGCYQNKNCNGGNLAAQPGYSNHQSGRAVDISNSGSSWVQNNAARFGFKRTVPSESWHFEYFGDDPGGPCSGGSGSADSCFSNTLKRDIPESECVQSRADNDWYICNNGAWVATSSGNSSCTKKFPL